MADDTTAQVPKDRTIAALGEVWASIGALLDDLSDDEWARSSPLPGWDVKDNVAHMIGTEQMLLGQPSPDVEIDRSDYPHVHNDIGAFNEVWVEHLRPSPPASIRYQFQQSTTDRLAMLEKMSQGEWDADSFTPAGRSTYGRFMQIRVFDCWLHEQDIRDATGRPGHSTGLGVEVTLDEMETAMGFVVGKKAGIESGQSVRFDLTDGGAVVRSVAVDVGDRARVVEELDGEPTATITLPVGVMTRLCAGRVDLADVRSEVTLGGDTDRAQRVLENLRYTI